MSTGVITTARLTHATPGAAYSHIASRDWESDAEMPPEAVAAGCADIARQLVEMRYGDGLEVAMGGGRSYFMPETAADPEDEGETGRRKDGKDLTQAWLDRYSNSGAFVWNKEQFDAIDAAQTDHLLGLFERSHMEYDHDRPEDTAGEPSLAEMTEKTIDILARNPEGFLLMIEGGRIDHASHESNAYRTVSDGVALNEAVKTVLRKVDLNETLIVVTGDHSHTLTIAGYAKRGNPILGISIGVDDEPLLGEDGKPYTTIGFANGPGGMKEPVGASGGHHGAGDRAGLHPAVAGLPGERDPWRRGSGHLRDRTLVASVPGHRRGKLHVPRYGFRLGDQREGQGEGHAIGRTTARPENAAGPDHPRRSACCVPCVPQRAHRAAKRARRFCQVDGGRREASPHRPPRAAISRQAANASDRSPQVQCGGMGRRGWISELLQTQHPMLTSRKSTQKSTSKSIT